MLYAHKRTISHPNRICFVCTALSLVLFTWQHTSAFQMSKQASSQLGSTDAEHLVRRVGLEEPGQGGSVAPQGQQEQAGTPLGWDPTWNWEIYHTAALFWESTSWWNNDGGNPPTHTWVLVTSLSEGDSRPLPCFLSHFRMDTPSSPATIFLLTGWRRWTATAGCWAAPQAQALACLLPWVPQKGQVGGGAQKGGSGTFHRLQGHENHLQVAACGSWDLKTRCIPRNTSVACHVFQGIFRNKQSHLPKSAQKASSLDPTASVLHFLTHKTSHSTIPTTKFLFFCGKKEHCPIKLKKNHFA